MNVPLAQRLLSRILWFVWLNITPHPRPELRASSWAFVFQLFLALQHLKKVFKILTNTTVIFLCFQTFYNRKQRTKPYNNSSEVWIASFISLECSKTLTVFWLIQQKVCCRIISLCLIQGRFGDCERFYFSAQQNSTFPERKQIFLLMEEAAWEEKFWHSLKGAAVFLSVLALKQQMASSPPPVLNPEAHKGSKMMEKTLLSSQ